MVAQPVPPPIGTAPFVDAKGHLTTPAFNFLLKLYDRSGGQADKVDSAHVLGTNAVPQGTEVVGGGGVQGGGALGGNVGLTLYVAISTVADLPSTTALSTGDWAYALDGCKTGEDSGAGTGVPCWWSIDGWYAADSGAIVSA